MANDSHMPADRVTVAVGAIVQDEAGRFLLVKHVPERGGFWQRRWIFPGGKLEPGESIVDGTKREVMEETNLEVQIESANPLVERIVKEGNAVPLHVLYVTQMARTVAGELRPASDVGEARWFTKEELSEVWNDLHEDTQTIATLAKII